MLRKSKLTKQGVKTAEHNIEQTLYQKRVRTQFIGSKPFSNSMMLNELEKEENRKKSLSENLLGLRQRKT